MQVPDNERRSTFTTGREQTSISGLFHYHVTYCYKCTLHFAMPGSQAVSQGSPADSRLQYGVEDWLTC
jgi:hypothetical protein